MVNYRLGLCLAVIATVIVVAPTEGGLLDQMDVKSGSYQHRVSRTRSFRDSSSASSAAYSSGGGSQAAAGAAAGNGRSGSYAQGFASTGRNRRRGAPPHPVHYDYDEPAEFEGYGDSSKAASGAGFGGSFANAQAQSAYGYSGADASAHSQNRPRNRRPGKNAYTAQRRSPPPAPDVYHPSSPSVPTNVPGQRFANGPSVSSSIAATSGGIAAAGAAGNAGSSTSATVSSGGPRAGQHASARSGNNRRRPGRFYGRPEEYYGEHNKQEPYGREGSVASPVASARTTGSGPASAAMASAQHDMHELEDEEEEESFSMPETVNEYSSRAGSYADDGNFQESGSYVRAYEDDQSYEQGDEEGDSYFGANSYGKAYDAHIDEVSHEKNEDTIKSDNYTHTKKNTVFKQVKGKISDHETGSSVKGKDKYRAQYGKGNRRVRDYVDQGFNRNAPGAVSNNHLSEVSGFDEETADSYDSRGMGNFPRRQGPSQPGPRPRRQNLAAKAAAAATAASASASSTGVTSSTTAAKN